MSNQFSSYKLSKWSRMIRIRDGHKCFLCEEDKTPRRLMEAHHIRPKAKYPDTAYTLSNGITLCRRCHHEIIHTSDSAPKKFYVLFHRYVGHKAIRKFNERYQCKLD